MLNISFFVFSHIIADSSLAEIRTQTESPVFKHKKNFKIWFSPRSRKVRCTVEKPSEVIVPDSRSSGETAAAQPDIISAQCKDLSVFNFTSSSQDSGSSCSQKCHTDNRNIKKRSTRKNAAKRKASVQGATGTTQKQTKQKMKKMMLEAINQQWGITEGIDDLTEKEQPCAEAARRSSKRVSFLSPADTSDEPQPEVSQGSTNELCLSPGKSTMRESLSGGSIIVLSNQAGLCQNMSNIVIQHGTLSANDPIQTTDREKQDKASPPNHSSKRSRVEEEVVTLDTTPKRPRASPGRRRKSLGQMSPVFLNPLFSTSPRCEKNAKNPREEQGESPSTPAIASRKSPSTHMSVCRLITGSPAVMKRNHKGETLLHLAAIKVKRFLNDFTLVY